MKLTCSKSKNSCIYYVQKSVRIGDRTTTKPVERLGSIEAVSYTHLVISTQTPSLQHYKNFQP